MTEVSGPGVILNIYDSAINNVTDNSIVHADDLRDIVSLLWGSGAEAISINNQRVVINTAIDCIVNTILINDVRLTPPFSIKAIGDRNILAERLTNPEVLKDIHSRKQKDGLIFEVSKNDDLIVPLFDGSFEFKNTSTN